MVQGRIHIMTTPVPVHSVVSCSSLYCPHWKVSTSLASFRWRATTHFCIPSWAWLRGCLFCHSCWPPCIVPLACATAGFDFTWLRLTTKPKKWKLTESNYRRQGICAWGVDYVWISNFGVCVCLVSVWKRMLILIRQYKTCKNVQWKHPFQLTLAGSYV